jgi:hypothetical protein
MPDKNFIANLLDRDMTRKEFVKWSALLVVSMFGVGGVLETLLSHAQSPSASTEAESGNLSSGAVAYNDSSASGGQAVRFSEDTGNTTGLLWEPDYSTELLDGVGIGTGEPSITNGGLIPGRLWHSIQPPYVRGVPQKNVFNVFTGSNVPGATSDPYRPAGAFNAQIETSSTSSDFTITATADATSTDTTVTFSVSDAAKLVYPGLGSATIGDFINNGNTHEHMRVTAQPVNGVVSVLRAQESTAAAVTAGDIFTIPTGEINPSAGYSSRSEVYGRFPAASFIDPVDWPDPVGSTRWYGISYYLPADMDTITGQGWWICTQFKGEFGGSPPLALSIDWSSDTENGKGTWKLEGTEGHPTVSIGDIKLGTWTRMVFGIHWDNVTVANGGTGWVEIYRDGVQMVAQTPACTMDSHGSGADPIYLKNGIYRTIAWKATHNVYIGPPKIGTAMTDVMDA